MTASKRHTPKRRKLPLRARRYIHPLRFENLEKRNLLTSSLGGEFPPAPTYDPSSILVRYRSEAAPPSAAHILSNTWAAKSFPQVGGLQSVELGAGVSVEEALAAFRASHDVLYAEPNHILHTEAIPNDLRLGDLWGLNNTGQSGGTADADIDAPEAWNISTGSRSVVVGVIDTGVDYTHPDLAANIWTNPGEIAGNSIDDDGNGFVDDIHGYDFVGVGDSNPMDDNRHGTHVAGTIGGVGNNGVGVAGAAWQVQIMALKFLSSGGSGTTADAIEAVNYATMMRNRGVNIVLTSNSWGGGGFSQALQDAIAASGTANMLFVAAAGNAGSNTDTSTNYPSGYPLANIISVAASDRNDAKATFSNWGATTVDLAAPGVDVLSTLPASQYGSLSGTSMATPHVAGIAALAWGVAGNVNYQVIRDAIFAGVDPNNAFRVGGPNPVATGGRLNAFRTLQLLGLRVAASSPAAGSAVNAPPTQYVIDFSNPVDPISVQPADFTVDGTAADSVVLNPTNTSATFTFSASPFTSEGLHTMRIAAGSITKQGDPASSNYEFNGPFRYDTVPLAVVSTSPPAGAPITVTTPFLYEVTFNEPLDPASVQAGDLAISGLSGAAVTAATVLDGNTTVRFTITGVASEGTLSVKVPALAVSDVFGNPNLAEFSASHSIDLGTISFPPLVAKLPLGSLAYGSAAAGLVGVAGDSDSFTLALDPGQALTVVATPTSSGLAPTVELRDPAGALLATAVAPAAGARALLPTTAIAAAGVYTVTVSGGGTTGNYTVEAALNAALEAENQGGPANDNIASAQNLDGSLVGRGGAEQIAIFGSIGAGPTGAAEDFEAGTLPSTFTTYASNSFGRIQITAPLGSGNASAFAMRMDSTTDFNYALNEAIWRVNLAGLTQANLSFAHIQFNDEPEFLPAGFTGHYNGDGVAISDDGNRWHTIQSAPTNSTWTTTNVDLAAAATAAGMQLGANFLIKFQQYDNYSYSTDGRAYDNIQITLPDPQDTYALSLAVGETISVSVKGLTSGNINAQFQDGSGAVLASAIAGPSNLDKSLADFRAPAAGTYYLVVTGGIGATYSSVVTKNGEFNNEPNQVIAQAQSLLSRQVAGEQWVIGHVGGTADSADLFKINLAAGATLVAETFTPSGGTGEFNNTLNPRLRILNSAGSVVASDENSADGLNALVTFANGGAAATLYLEVATTAQGAATSGEYSLKVSGNTIATPIFQVTATSPANGAVLGTSPPTVVIDFNDALLATSVQASDLVVDGTTTSASMTLVDGNTVSFALPLLTPGAHTLTLAGGSIQDAQGTPLAAYSGTLTIDTTAPRVTTTSLAPGGVAAPGALSYQVTFSEPMKISNLSSADFSLRGNGLNLNYSASTFSFNASGTVLTLNYLNLPEDSYTLNLVSGATAGPNFTDVAGHALDGEFTGTFPSGNGSAGGDFAIAFVLDAATTPLPTLAAKLPLGALIYDRTAIGGISPAGDTDGFTVTLDAGQTVSVLVTPTSATLTPSVELRDPANVTLGSATAAGAGGKLILQTLTARAAGTYTVVVSGAGNSLGAYSVGLTLNAALETEGVSGPTNDTITAAQNLDNSSVGIGESAARLAVLGTTSGGSKVIAAENFESGVLPASFITYSSNSFGRIAVAVPVGSGNSSAFALRMDSSSSGASYALNEAVYSVNLAGVSQPTLQFSHMQYSDEPESLPATFTGHVNGDGVAISDDGNRWHTILNAPTNSTWTTATIDLAQAAAAAGMTLDPNFKIKFQQYDNYEISTDGRAYDNIQINVPEPLADYYQFTLAAGDTATLALTAQAAGNLSLELRDSTDAVLATGTGGTTNQSKSIGRFVASTGGTYYARVTGDSNAAYSLLLTNSAGFDTEPNDSFIAAQAIHSSQKTVLGFLSAGPNGGPNEDWYSIDVTNPGSTLELATNTPGDGPNQFVNTLNPRIELYDPTGALVASGSGLQDGRNESIQYRPLVTGAFRVRVTAENGTTGEYVLNLRSATPRSANHDLFITSEDTAITVGPAGVLANDVDGGGTPLTAVLASPPLNGSLTFSSSGGFTYAPTSNFNGTDSFTYRANNGQSLSSLATVTLMITPVNDAPAALSNGYSIFEDVALTVSSANGVLTNDTDPDGNALTALLETPPAQGTLILNTNGTFIYTPNSNVSGVDTFTYRASDGHLASNLATVTLNITAVNDVPVAVPDTYQPIQDTTFTVPVPGVLANDFDVESNSLTATLVNGPTKGTLTLQASGAFAYAPNAGFSGVDSFSYRASDGQQTATPVIVVLNVTPTGAATLSGRLFHDLNQNGVFEATAGETPLVGRTVYIDANNSGALDSTTERSQTTGPDGRYTFTNVLPGQARISQVVPIDWVQTSPTGPSNILVSLGRQVHEYSRSRARVQSLTVPPPIPQAASWDVWDAVADQAGRIHVFQASISEGYISTYTPSTRTWEHHTRPGLRATTDIGDNELTIRNNHLYMAIWRFDITDWTSIQFTPPPLSRGGGDVRLAANGKLYAHNAGSPQEELYEFDPNTFALLKQWSLRDQSGQRIHMVGMEVTPQGDIYALTIEGRLFHYNYDGALQNFVPNFHGANGIDLDMSTDGLLSIGTRSGNVGLIKMDFTESTTIIVGSQTSFFNHAGFATYQGATPSPTSHFLALSAGESRGGLDFGSIRVGPNVAPVATNDTFSASSNYGLTIVPHTGVLTNDTDANGDSLAALLVTGPTNGTLALSPNGSFVYTPNAGFAGIDSFAYVANDGTGNSSSAVVTLTVNDWPVAVQDSYAIAEDQSLIRDSALGVLANDTDVVAGPLSAVLVAGPSHGTLSLGSAGDFVYTPVSNFHGADSFTYRARDGIAHGSTATVSITVSPVNDAPIATPDNFATVKGVAITVGALGVLANDFDVDGGNGPSILSVAVPPLHGDLQLNSDGSFTYTPLGKFAGADSFVYRLSDGTAQDSVAVVSIAVAPLVATGVTASLSGSQLVVVGTAFKDDVVIDQFGLPGAEIRVLDSGNVVFTAASSSVASIFVNAGAGDDLVAIDPSFGTRPTLLLGWEGNDTLIGGEGDDYLDGIDGDDTLVGNGGNDSLIGNNFALANSGTDKFDGGLGNDTVSADALDLNAPHAMILGGPGPSIGTAAGFGDTLNLLAVSTDLAFNNDMNPPQPGGIGGFETIFGGSGNDTITVTNATVNDGVYLIGGAGDDVLIGGPANDALQGGAGNDRMIGLAGADTFVGDTGIDTVDYSVSPAPAAPVPGFAGINGVVADLRAGFGSLGSSGGHAQGDMYLANDVEALIGTASNDYLIGNLLHNLLDGLAGDDTIIGNQGHDNLVGGLGNDTLIGSDGALFTDFDRFDGGAGDDHVYADAADLTGNSPEKILGGAGSADILDFLFSGGVTFHNNFDAGALTGGFDQIFGSSGDDHITTTGTQAPSVYYVGFAGNDTLQGGSGNDTLNGADGDDALTGGAGADTFIGGLGDDNASDINAGDGDASFGIP